MTQPALFPTPARHRTASERRAAVAAKDAIARAHERAAQARRAALQAAGHPPLGEPIDQADADLGRRHPYITPRRANQIRREIDEDRRLLGTTRPPRGSCRRCRTNG